MNIEEVLKKLKGYIYSEHGTQTTYAKYKGLSKSMVSSVLSGDKNIPDCMLDDINLVRKVEYVKKK